MSSPGLWVRNDTGGCELTSLFSLRALVPPQLCVLRKARLPWRKGWGMGAHCEGMAAAVLQLVSELPLVWEALQTGAGDPCMCSMAMGTQGLRCWIRLLQCPSGLGSCSYFRSLKPLPSLSQLPGWDGAGASGEGRCEASCNSLGWRI